MPRYATFKQPIQSRHHTEIHLHASSVPVSADTTCVLYGAEETCPKQWHSTSVNHKDGVFFNELTYFVGTSSYKNFLGGIYYP